MKARNDPRACRTALATAVATVALWGSFGAYVHAEDEPVAPPPVETGQNGGAVVAVGPPPVPPPTVVVAVGAPPVPPTLVVVAVGAPPVPPVSVPAVSEQAQAPDTPRATPPAAVGFRQPTEFTARLTAMFADLFARIEAILALLSTGF